jgi:hypothetical protein
MVKRSLPAFLELVVSREGYERWLLRKAAAHVKRDRKRGHQCDDSAYRDAIHQAVVRSGGRDAYTGEELDWTLISKYDNEASKAGRHSYKSSFALLPTVDHVAADATSASFNICGWRTNDSKHDLSVDAFVKLCRSVLEHAGYRVEDPVAFLSDAGNGDGGPERCATTSAGYRNRNGQLVVRATTLPGNDHRQRIYVLRCGSCGREYGANGSDIFQRRCPACGGGRPGLEFS